MKFQIPKIGLLKKLIADKVALAAFIFFSVVVISSVLSSFITPYDPRYMDISKMLLPPLSGGHLLGTDGLGRDVFSLLLEGGKVSILIAVSAVAISATLGIGAGIFAGYYGGIRDMLITRLIDVQLAFTGILLIMIVISVFGPGVLTLILVLGVTSWIIHGRIVRGMTLYVRELAFIEAAKSMGAGTPRILLQHIFPNIFSVELSAIIIEVSRMMVVEALLSFVGFGVQPPTITWGLVLAQGRDLISVGWWVVFFPGFAIFSTVLSLNIIGRWFRSQVDPSRRRLVISAKEGV